VSFQKKFRDQVLKPRKRFQDLESFGVIDIETMNWTKFIVLGCYDGDTYQEFRSLTRFFEYLKTGAGPSLYFAHFGGKFDFLFLLESAFGSKLVRVDSVIPRGSSILSIDLTIGARRVTFRDSAALLPFGLKALTNEFNVKTKKGEWDHAKTRGYSKGLSEYLESDCKGLWEVLQLFYSQPLLSGVKPAYTIASQSLEVFRQSLGDLWLESLGKEAEQFIRPAYLGGRTEIFRPVFQGKRCQKLFEYDVNSLYPFILKTQYFPKGRPYFTRQYKPDFLGVYEVEAEAPDNLFLPVLGLVHDGKFIFPVGKIKGKWTTAEINLALSKGYKINVIRGIVFPDRAKYFEKFIDRLYEMRLNSKKGSVSDVTAKLIMNSLYGRLGMNPEKEKITFKLSEGVKEFVRFKVKRKNLILFSEPHYLDSFRNVAIAAFVTSYARVHLYNLMDRVQDTLYYCDTDSIFTTSKMRTSKKLGALKFENEYKNAVFLLPKTYSLEGVVRKLKMKGFEKKKTELFSHDDFKNYFDGTLKQLKAVSEPKFATMKTAIRQGRLVAMTKRSTKQIRARYDKRRIVISDGKITTVPIELGGMNETNSNDKNANQKTRTNSHGRGDSNHI